MSRRVSHVSLDQYHETDDYTLLNLGVRYRFTLVDLPAMLRLRIHNASDTYAWDVGSSGIYAYEPERRLTLSLALGE